MAIWEVNPQNRTLAVDQLSAKLSEVDVDVGSSKLQFWLKVMETMEVQQRVTSSLLLTLKTNRVDFMLDQVAPDRKTLSTSLDRIHVGNMVLSGE